MLWDMKATDWNYNHQSSGQQPMSCRGVAQDALKTMQCYSWCNQYVHYAVGSTQCIIVCYVQSSVFLRTICIAQCSMHRTAVHNDAGVAGLLERPPTGRTVLSSSRQATTILIIIIIIISKQCAIREFFYTYIPMRYVTIRDSEGYLI